MLNEEEYLKGYFKYLTVAKKLRLPVSDSNFKRARFFALAGWCEAIAGGKVTNVAECGCYLGHSSYMISHTLKSTGFDGVFHIFDSFEGLSDFSSEDLVPATPGVAVERLKKISPQSDRSKPRPFFGSERVLLKVLEEFPFIKTYKGWIPSRFNEVSELTFGLVALDLDIYQPTLDALRFFYPRLKSGGVIWLDDFGLNTWPGCSRAVFDFKAGLSGRDLFMKNPFGGLVIVKM